MVESSMAIPQDIATALERLQERSC